MSRVNQFVLITILSSIVTMLTGCGADGAGTDDDTSVTKVLTLTSSAMSDGGSLPVAYTCDGDGLSPPISWSYAIDETTSNETAGYAIVMHHVPGPDDTHWYWVIYDIPAETTALNTGETNVGTFGINSVDGQQTYAPPCSQGSGEKLYTITVYALSDSPNLPDPSIVDRDALLTAIEDITLDSATMNVIYDRNSTTDTDTSDSCNDKSAAFTQYSNLVSTECDELYLYVNTPTGLAEQNPTDSRDLMMVGITAWINRVPIPYGLTWQIPLQPDWYSNDWGSASARGPIAFAANGVPIFHYEKRPDVDTDPRVYDYREENDTVLQGELDQCGGHSGQGDDYHYHYAPICLLNEHDLAQPIAFGTDGVPVYFGTGGDDFYGSGRYNEVNNLPADVDLDDCNSALQDDGTYVYYTTSEVPYVIGCHRARVADDIGMDVPPLQGRSFQEEQPNGSLAGEPLYTEITDLSTDAEGWSHLIYDDGLQSVSYKASDEGDDCWDFQWSDAPSDQIYTYCR